MNRSPLYQHLHSLPKVDLHRHLEGSIRPETFLELVLPQDVLLPTYDPYELLRHVQVMDGEPAGFMNFLSKFFLLHYMYTSPEVYYRIMHEVVEDAAKDNVVHLELRFSLKHLTRHMNFDMRDVIGWLHEARVQAERKYNVSVLLIPMLNREASRELCEQIVDAVLAQPAGVIAALDLAGDELHNPIPPVVDLFDRARDHGLNIVVHAGEARGPEVVENCLSFFRPSRLGHGVHAVESSRTLKMLKEQNVVLEVCPTSNVQTGATPSLAEHQLKKLHEAGVQVTINSDDPRISRTTLTNEYYLAVEQIGLSLEAVEQSILTAAKASYLLPEAKAQLLQRLHAEVPVRDAQFSR